MAATVQAALAVVKFYFLAAVLEVEAEEALAAGRCSKVIWKFKPEDPRRSWYSHLNNLNFYSSIWSSG